MTWTRIYHLALRTLPPELRRKHGSAMEALFARAVAQSYERGRLPGTLAGAAGVWDVIQRAVYEYVGNGPDHLHESHATPMPTLTPRQLLRRHAPSFVVSFVTLTTLLVGTYAMRRPWALSAVTLPFGARVEIVALAVPFTAALTIPMAVFVTVLHVFTELGAEGTLAAARQERGGVRRLVAPVLGAAVGVAAFMFLLTSQIVPRTNQRLVVVRSASTTPAARSDRTMTIGELRAAARNARQNAGPQTPARLAGYEVEVQKKYSLAAACVVLALAAAALGLRFPRGGTALVSVVSLVVFGMYYVCLTTGESLAMRLVISPVLAMWGANAIFLAAGLLMVQRTSSLARR